MRSILTPSLLAVIVAAALPGAAGASSVPFDVSVRGTIQEQWTADQDPVSDGCGRRTTGSGGATLSFATARPYRLTLDSYTGFHSKPAVGVTVNRQGRVSTTEPGVDCSEPAPAASGCGARSYQARIDLGTRTPWTKQLTIGDEDLFSTPGSDCPLPGDFGVPSGLRSDRFQTVDLLQAYGPKLRITRKLFGGCDAHGGCNRARKRTVIAFHKHIEVPFLKAGQEFGSYTADVDWTITTVARFRLPPRR
jgi:hypothetical protein